MVRSDEVADVCDANPRNPIDVRLHSGEREIQLSSVQRTLRNSDLSLFGSDPALANRSGATDIISAIEAINVQETPETV